MPINSIKHAAIGICTLAFWGGVGYHSLIANPTRRLTEQDLQTFSGKVSKTEEVVTGKRDARSLQIWLVDQPLPFRGLDGAYPEIYDQNVVARIKPGSNLQISVVRSRIKSPPKDSTRNQRFHEIVALNVNKEPALNLAIYNEWNLNNAATGQLVIPILFLVSLGLTIDGLRPRSSKRASATQSSAG
jgi:hypothetical protein